MTPNASTSSDIEHMRRKLAEAREDQSPVCLRRSIPGAVRISGFVHDFGTEWVLVAVLDPEVFLDGFCALRVRDIEQIREAANSDFWVEALKLEGSWPPAKPRRRVRLDSTPDLLVDACRISPLVSIYVQHNPPDVFNVGRIVELTKRSVRLLEIDSEAEWITAPTSYQFAAINRVDINGRYERALYRVGRKSFAAALSKAQDGAGRRQVNRIRVTP